MNPQVMTAYSMDQKVTDIQRAAFWKAKGYSFDPNIMTAFSMDQKVVDIERAKFWRAKGYSFDPNTMTAFSMDQKVVDIERAKFWKAKGYSFDPNTMTAFSMDQEAANSTPHSSPDQGSQTTDIPRVYPATIPADPPRAIAVASSQNTSGNVYQTGMLAPLAKSVVPKASHIQATASPTTAPSTGTTP
jgi:hypothetical protein